MRDHRGGYSAGHHAHDPARTVALGAVHLFPHARGQVFILAEQCGLVLAVEPDLVKMLDGDGNGGHGVSSENCAGRIGALVLTGFHNPKRN